MTFAGGKKSSSSSSQQSMPSTTAPTKRTPKAPSRDCILVTPEMAKSILETRNGVNRKLTPADVREYARRMDSGEWHLNGECLKFDEDGLLFEGQHRLHAVVLHGKPVWFERIVNAPREDRFNDGGRPRSLGDYLVIAEVVPDSDGVRAAAIVETIGSLIAGAPRGFRSRNSANKDEVLAIGRAYKDEIRWALGIFPKGCFAPVVGAFTYAYSVKGSKVEDFAHYWMSPERTAGSPAVALTNMLKDVATNTRNGGTYRLEIAQRTLTAIHAHIKGKRLSVLRRSDVANDFFKGRK